MLRIIKSSLEDNSPVCHITVGEIDLHGMLLSSPKAKTACLFVHGTGGTFYGDAWVFKVANALIKNKISFLTMNHRGSTSLSSYPPHGATLEKFDGCVNDIDGWLSFLKRKGFTKFILAGHSLGTEKIVHYMSQTNRKDIQSIILLGFSDSFGTTRDYLGNRFDRVMKEAKSLKKQGRGEEFLTTDWLSHGGILPTSAKTFIDFFSANSLLSQALPLRSSRLEKYSKITVPILAAIGDQEEYTASSLKHAIDLMKSENKNSTVEQITNCDHDFTGQTSKLCKIITNFVNAKLKE
ncbi:hypothetical protein LCGC14_2110250 [marine sediment metagenome]|uniref:Serine aminopeptidase S33 domain-containing protein n=1 Tax=marine sediment metagenome TaxID=412755 RepID=A0A0F9E7E2_9ZZZZ